jgi:predicted dehydrogenase
MSKKIIDNSEVRWGVIGAGDVCKVKSAPAMNKIPNSKLVAVMRRTGEKARQYAEDHNVPNWYDNAGELLNDPEVNAVYIATPPGSHAELTKKAATAGKPVYVEKPMARTYQECLEMIEACENAGVPLFVAYYRRRLPNFLRIKELVDSGIIGDIRMVNIRMYKPVDPNIVAGREDNWRVNPDIAGGGYFYDLASHQLDFLDYLFGPISEASGISSNQAGLYEAEDIVTGNFRFGNGILGTGSWCFTTGKSSNLDTTEIIGSKGEISYPSFGESWVSVNTDGDGSQRYDFEMPRHIQQPLIETVVDELLGKGECPSTGVSAARTNLVLEQMRNHPDINE